MAEKKSAKDITAILLEGRDLDKALQAAVRKDLLRHVAEGVPAVVWEDGQVVEIPPEKIPERLSPASRTE